MRYREPTNLTNEEIVELEKEGDRLVKEASQKGAGRIYSRRKLKDAASTYRQALKNYEEVVTFGMDINKRKKGVQSKINSIESKLKEITPKTIDNPYYRDFRIKILPVLSIVFLLGALVFTSMNLTGYAISNTTQDNLKWIGVILFVIGLIFAIIYLKNKERKKSKTKKRKKK